MHGLSRWQRRRSSGIRYAPPSIHASFPAILLRSKSLLNFSNCATFKSRHSRCDTSQPRRMMVRACSECGEGACGSRSCRSSTTRTRCSPPHLSRSTSSSLATRSPSQHAPLLEPLLPLEPLEPLLHFPCTLRPLRAQPPRHSIPGCVAPYAASPARGGSGRVSRLPAGGIKQAPWSRETLRRPGRRQTLREGGGAGDDHVVVAGHEPLRGGPVAGDDAADR